MSTIYDPKFKVAMDILKRKRTEVGMTQIEMSKKIGCSQGYVSKYEQGQVRLDIIEIRRICECLGLSLVGYVQLLEEEIKQLHQE